MEYQKKHPWNPYGWQLRYRVPVGVALLVLPVVFGVWPWYRDANYHGITYCTLRNRPTIWYNRDLDVDQRRIAELHEEAHKRFLSSGNCWGRAVATLGNRLEYEAEGFCAEVPYHLAQGEAYAHVMGKLEEDLASYRRLGGLVTSRKEVRLILDRACGSG